METMIMIVGSALLVLWIIATMYQIGKLQKQINDMWRIIGINTILIGKQIKEQRDGGSNGEEHPNSDKEMVEK